MKFPTMWYILCIPFMFIMHLHTAEGNEIPFLKYCLDGSNPESISQNGIESSGSFVMSENHEMKAWYEPGLNCSVTLSTARNFYLFLTFSNVSLRNASMDNLTVFYDNDNSTLVLSGQQVCSNENCFGLKFYSGQFNNITLKFISANVSVPRNLTGFIAHYTVYDVADPQTGACKGKHRFLCENKNCISYELVCDGHNNCGDLSDETKCIIPVKDTVWGILVIIVAIIVVIVFVPIFCLLATHGTRNMVKSVMVPNQPTPLLNATDCGETSGLLTSSEAVNQCWPGSSYERRSSFTYGSADRAESQTDTGLERKFSTGIVKSEENRFL